MNHIFAKAALLILANTLLLGCVQEDSLEKQTPTNAFIELTENRTNTRSFYIESETTTRVAFPVVWKTSNDNSGSSFGSAGSTDRNGSTRESYTSISTETQTFARFENSLKIVKNLSDSSSRVQYAYNNDSYLCFIQTNTTDNPRLACSKTPGTYQISSEILSNIDVRFSILPPDLDSYFAYLNLLNFTTILSFSKGSVAGRPCTEFKAITNYQKLDDLLNGIYNNESRSKTERILKYYGISETTESTFCLDEESGIPLKVDTHHYLIIGGMPVSINRNTTRFIKTPITENEVTPGESVFEALNKSLLKLYVVCRPENHTIPFENCPEGMRSGTIFIGTPITGDMIFTIDGSSVGEHGIYYYANCGKMHSIVPAGQCSTPEKYERISLVVDQFNISYENPEYYLAIRNLDIDLCLSLNESSKCMAAIAIVTGDESLCEFSSDKKECHGNTFDKIVNRQPATWMMGNRVLLEDSDIRSLEISGQLEDAYFDVKKKEEVTTYNEAIREADENKCKLEYLSDLCFAHIGKIKNKRTICEHMELKEKCHNFYDNIDFANPRVPRVNENPYLATWVMRKEDMANLEKLGYLEKREPANPRYAELNMLIKLYNLAVFQNESLICPTGGPLGDLCLAHIGKIWQDQTLCVWAQTESNCITFYNSLNFTRPARTPEPWQQ